MRGFLQGALEAAHQGAWQDFGGVRASGRLDVGYVSRRSLEASSPPHSVWHGRSRFKSQRPRREGGGEIIAGGGDGSVACICHGQKSNRWGGVLGRGWLAGGLRLSLIKCGCCCCCMAARLRAAMWKWGDSIRSSSHTHTSPRVRRRPPHTLVLIGHRPIPLWRNLARQQLTRSSNLYTLP
jgi:hypothetical protein